MDAGVSCPETKSPGALAGVRKTALCRNQRSGTKPNGADRAGAGEAKRRDRKAESRKPNGMGAADERLQGTGRGSCKSGIDLQLSEEVRAENCSDFSYISQKLQ